MSEINFLHLSDISCITFLATMYIVILPRTATISPGGEQEQELLLVKYKAAPSNICHPASESV
jgi:hypothetical protein